MNEYTYYESVSYKVFRFKEIDFTVNIILGKKDYNGQRRSIHSEYQYKTKKYPNANVLRMIKLEPESNLTISSIKKDDDGMKSSVFIRNIDLYRLKLLFIQAGNWFGNNHVIYTNKGISLNNPPPPVEAIFFGNKIISLTPIIAKSKIDSKENLGVRITINNTVFDDLCLEEFMMVLDFISTLNLSTYALMLMTYMGRPDYGYNMYAHEKDITQEIEHQNGDSIQKGGIRTIEKKRSFFDKMDNI